MGGDQLVDRLRPPGAGRVGAHRGRGFQQRRRHLPEPLDALGGGEQGPVAAHRVEDQPLIGFEHVAREARVMHGELHAELVEPHAGARPLAVEGERHLRRIGEVEGQMIRSLLADARA